MEKVEIEEALYMARKQISKRTAQKKYGICISDNGRYYLRDAPALSGTVRRYRKRCRGRPTHSLPKYTITA